MPIYVCSQCGARNTRSGQCVSCLESLGSVKKAIDAALISGAVMSLIWIGLAVVTGLQLTVLALIFGGVISVAVTRYSGGVGPLYQGIATAATFLSILVADTIVVILLWNKINPGSGPAPSFSYALLEFQIQHDPFTFMFVGLGVAGGLFIWREW
jgi:hypothetical protein